MEMLVTRTACLLQDAQQMFTLFKTNRQKIKRKPSPIISSFLNWAEETVDAAKICGGAENVVKQKNPANIRKWIARFYYFRHLYSAEARVYCSHTIRVAHRYGQLYLHCSLIYSALPVVFAGSASL